MARKPSILSAATHCPVSTAGTPRAALTSLLRTFAYGRSGPPHGSPHRPDGSRHGPSRLLRLPTTAATVIVGSPAETDGTAISTSGQVATFTSSTPEVSGASLGALLWDETLSGQANFARTIKMFGAGGAMALSVEDFLYVVQGLVIFR